MYRMSCKGKYADWFSNYNDMGRTGFSYEETSDETSDYRTGELLIHDNNYYSINTVNSVLHMTVTNIVSSNTSTPKFI
jgi:hypothetical protein